MGGISLSNQDKTCNHSVSTCHNSYPFQLLLEIYSLAEDTSLDRPFKQLHLLMRTIRIFREVLYLILILIYRDHLKLFCSYYLDIRYC